MTQRSAEFSVRGLRGLRGLRAAALLAAWALAGGLVSMAPRADAQPAQGTPTAQTEQTEQSVQASQSAQPAQLGLRYGSADTPRPPPEPAPDLLDFSPAELRRILQHGPWPPAAPLDPGNALAGRPQAIDLGRQLFFDARLSPDGRFACATCHAPAMAFADRLARSAGREALARNAPSLWNAGHQRWYGWDGAFDSLWSQALHPLLDAREMASSAEHVQRVLAGEPQLACLYRAAFAEAPRATAAPAAQAIQVTSTAPASPATADTSLVPAPSAIRATPAASPVQATHSVRPAPVAAVGQATPAAAAARANRESWAGPAAPAGHAARPTRAVPVAPSARDAETVLIDAAKALGAFVGTLVSGRTAFDDFRDALARGDLGAAARYPAAAQRGARLFVGRGQCSTCHVGPLFSNGEFGDIGLPFFVRPGVVDPGRQAGIAALRASPYNLVSRWSDAVPGADAAALKTRHVEAQHRNFGEFKVPGLRNVAETAPYMHDGQLPTLDAVVRHYSELNLDRLHADGEQILKPLNLDPGERADLVAFLRTLSDPQASSWRAPALAACDPGRAP